MRSPQPEIHQKRTHTLEIHPKQSVCVGISCVVYLILGVSCTDEQQLKRSQVSHALAWTLDCGLQKRLTQLSEDPTVIQHSDRTREKERELRKERVVDKSYHSFLPHRGQWRRVRRVQHQEQWRKDRFGAGRSVVIG